MKISKSAQFILACICLMFGLGLIVAGFLVPPIGVIDSTVLVAYGETLTFCGSIIGIDYHYRQK